MQINLTTIDGVVYSVLFSYKATVHSSTYDYDSTNDYESNNDVDNPSQAFQSSSSFSSWSSISVLLVVTITNQWHHCRTQL